MKKKNSRQKSVSAIAHFIVILLVISLIPLATLYVSAEGDSTANGAGSPEFEEPDSFVDPDASQANPSGAMSLTKGETIGESTNDDLSGAGPIAGISPLGIPGGGEGPVCKESPNLNITISKKVIGQGGTDPFEFRIFLEENVLVGGSNPNCQKEIKVTGTRKYTKNGVTGFEMTFVEGWATVDLKDKDSITIQTRQDSNYLIKEENNDTDCTVSVKVDTQASQEITEISGKIESNMSVVFTNTYPNSDEVQEHGKGSLKIEKITEGPFELGRIFFFSVVPTPSGGLEQAGQAEQSILRQAGSSDPGNEQMTLTSSTNTDDERQLATGGRINTGGIATSKEIPVELEANNSATIENLAEGWYLVKELDAEDCDVFTYSEGSGLVAMSTKGVKWFPGSSRIVQVVKDQTTTVTFKNVKVAPGFVTVKKTVTGEGADPEGKFKFILNWTLEDSSTSIIDRIKDEDMVPEEGSLGLSRGDLPPSGTQGDRINAALSDQGSQDLTRTGGDQPGQGLRKTLTGKKEFSLGDGEQWTFDDIPLGASFTVIEEDSSNLVGIKVDGQEVKAATGTVRSGEIVIEFENKRIAAADASQQAGELVAGDEDTIIPATGVNTVTLFMGLVMMTMGTIAMVFGGRAMKRKED